MEEGGGKKKRRGKGRGGGGGQVKGEGRVAKSYTIYRHLQTQMGQRRQDTMSSPSSPDRGGKTRVLSLLSRQRRQDTMSSPSSPNSSGVTGNMW